MNQKGFNHLVCALSECKSEGVSGFRFGMGKKLYTNQLQRRCGKVIAESNAVELAAVANGCGSS